MKNLEFTLNATKRLEEAQKKTILNNNSNLESAHLVYSFLDSEDSLIPGVLEKI